MVYDHRICINGNWESGPAFLGREAGVIRDQREFECIEYIEGDFIYPPRFQGISRYASDANSEL